MAETDESMAEPRTPILVIAGALGSGKTTLLTHLLPRLAERAALLINEFGELGIDGATVEGENVALRELAGGCVCCSLTGEFEAAVQEIVERVAPERILVETTGVAEPDALIFDIEDQLAFARLDAVVTVVDADALARFPELGHTDRLQIEQADLLLLNKTDLVAADALPRIAETLAGINPEAPLVRTTGARIDPALVLGTGRRGRHVAPPDHAHQIDLEAITHTAERPLDRAAFESFAEALPASVFRAKGFVRFPDGCHLFHHVLGRHSLEPAPEGPEETRLVLIGRGLREREAELRRALADCEARS